MARSPITKEQAERFKSHCLYPESHTLTTQVAFSIIADHCWREKTIKGVLNRALRVTNELVRIMEEVNE